MISEQKKLELIQAKISENPLLTDDQLFSYLTEKNIPSKQSIAVVLVKQYLMISGIWLSIKKGTSDVCEIARDALANFDEFDLRIPEVELTLVSILDGLVADNLVPAFTLQHKTEILSMGTSLQSWSDINVPDLTIGDIERARA